MPALPEGKKSISVSLASKRRTYMKKSSHMLMHIFNKEYKAGEIIGTLMSETTEVLRKENIPKLL